jgi:hypothetical protein
MMGEGETIGSDGAQQRSVLNAVAAIRADLDQMQRDIDKLRASSNATLMVGCYVLACSVIIFLSVRYPKAAP